MPPPHGSKVYQSHTLAKARRSQKLNALTSVRRNYFKRVLPEVASAPPSLPYLDPSSGPASAAPASTSTALHPAVRKKEARKHGLPRAYEAAAAAAALAASNRALVASQAEVRAAAIAAAEKRRRKTAAVYRQHTPRGQPVMAGRMAALLGKVERAVGR